MFLKFIKVSGNKFGIHLLYCISLPGYTRRCGLKNTGINLETLQNKDMISLLGNNIGGGISSVIGDLYVKSDENKKILSIDATNLYDPALSESLPYDENEMWQGHPDLYMKNLGEILNTSDDSDIGYFIEADLRYPVNIKKTTKNIPFCPEKKVIPKD